MATVNLGRIKPVFRGAYSGSTAYVVDDIVTHGNESFICIQAHGAGTQATSQTAYWTKLAAKGADGTDVGTTITTQGDILYRDGSGLQRLAKGTAGQVLKMNTAANAPEWGTDAGGKIGQVLQTVLQGTYSIAPGANTWGTYSSILISITPTAANSKIWIGFNFTVGCNNWAGFRIERDIGGGGYSHLSAASGTQEGNRQAGVPAHGYRYNDANQNRNVNFAYLDSPNTTSAVTYKLGGITHDSSSIYIGRTHSNDNYHSVTRTSTYINAWEVLY